MNVIVVLFALALAAEDDRSVALTVAECQVPETNACSRPTRQTCCRSLLGSLFGHRRCCPPKRVAREVMAITDPGGWYVHRMGTAPATYWYQIDHKVSGGSGVNPAACPRYDTIQQAADAVLCLQSDMTPSTKTCDPCTPNPIYPPTGTNWWTRRYGSGPSSWWYRINHVALSTAETCPDPATHPTGYVNTDLIKALNAVVLFQKEMCPPCPTP